MLVAVAAGIPVGLIFKEDAVPLEALGDGFVALIKLMIAPIIFCTIAWPADCSHTAPIGRWTGELDKERAERVLSGDYPFDEATMLDETTTRRTAPRRPRAGTRPPLRC